MSVELLAARTVFLSKMPETRLKPTFQTGRMWRSGWDSNPRTVARHLISSQGRYDHFDTAPKDISTWFARWKLERKPGEKPLTSIFKRSSKALKNKGLPGCLFQKARTISSQGRYDHFDTPPGAGSIIAHRGGFVKEKTISRQGKVRRRERGKIGGKARAAGRLRRFF